MRHDQGICAHLKNLRGNSPGLPKPREAANVAVQVKLWPKMPDLGRARCPQRAANEVR